ncbi:MAG: site-2 protease family protein [Methylothermaceae bacterium]|nr:site-2 protease family protein [Methylothermaceae bacterium]
MESLTLAQKISVWVLPILFAITLHEVAHGAAARWFGDDTAKRLGRLSINPLKHIDPVGTVAVPLIMLLLGGFIFGWAKPVPVDFGKLHRPKRDMALVALAGPGANLLMALGWSLLAKLGVWLEWSYISLPLIYMGAAGIFFNLVLMVLNLLPVPPLDGGRVLAGILPTRWSVRVAHLEPYGLPILLLLLVTGALGRILGPVIFSLQGVFFGLAGLA